MRQIHNHYRIMHTENDNLAALDLNLLSVLHALLSTESVSKASALTHRTQPATSHALKRLRLHFGDPLLVRDGWQMRPTPLGRSLRAPVQEAVSRVVQVFDRGEPFDPSNSARQVRIAARDICTPLLSPLIAEIARHAPRVTVKIGSPADLRGAVLAHEADLALRFGRVRTNASLVCTVAATLNWAVVAPKDHPYAKRRTVQEWTRAAHVVVAGQGEEPGPIERAVTKRRLDRHVKVIAPGFLAALALAGECNALFTTLRQPFEPFAAALGLSVSATPFALPNVSAALVRRAEFSDPFERWLGEMADRAFDRNA